MSDDMLAHRHDVEHLVAEDGMIVTL
jgi:hypothetical protein